MNKVIITGATGFIGRNLVKYFSARDVEVYAVSRRWAYSDLDKLCGVYHVTCTLSEISQLSSLIPKGEYDAFYHLAWEGSTGNGRKDYRIQANNSVSVCDAVIASKEIGCKRFITPGTIAEFVAQNMMENDYTAETLIYARAKIFAHNLLNVVAKNNNIDYVWAVFSNIFGGDNKNGNLISYTLNEFDLGRTPTYGPCLQPYNFTYIKDVLEILAGLGEAKETADQYFISNGDCRLLKDYLETIAKMCGKEISVGVRPDDGVRYKAEWFSNEALVKDIGYKPLYTFEEGVQEILSERS